MPAVPQTSNLGLWLPTPDEYNLPAPNWGQLLNENFQALAAAVPSVDNPLNPSAINIDRDLSFNGHAATDLEMLQFNPQTGTFGAEVTNAFYSVAGNAYFNNGSGVPVQITDGNSIVGTSGSIGGLPSTPAGAAVTYNNATGFTFRGFGGDFYSPLVSGPVRIFDTATGPAAYGITLKSPAALAASVEYSLPSAAPATGKTYALLCNSSGVMSFAPIALAQMAAQSPADLTPGSGWTGAAKWWQDQTGMVHVWAYLTAPGSPSDTATVLVVPVAPYDAFRGNNFANSWGIFTTAVKHNFVSGDTAGVRVDLDGNLSIYGATGGQGYSINLSYLGAI